MSDDIGGLLQADTYGKLMAELVSMKEHAVLKNLICGMTVGRTLVDTLREAAVDLLLEADAFEDARAISRLHYEECGQIIRIMITIAGASRERPDIDLARLTVRMRGEVDLMLVRCILDLWSAVGEGRDLLDAREVADFLPPKEKSEAYLLIGQLTCLREDFLTSIEATRAITEKDARQEALKKIAEVLSMEIGTTFDEWAARQTQDTNERVVH